MKRRHLAVLLTLFSAIATAWGQPSDPPPLDFSLSFGPAGIPVPVRQGAIALVVRANRWTETKEPFVVRLTVPPEIEITSQCEGATTYDAATRVFTWAGFLDNPTITTCPITFKIAPLLPPGTIYTLTATLTTSSPDANPSNNTASTYGVVYAAADIGLTISADPPRLKPGSTITYTFTLTNRGPDEGHSVVLTDQISPDVDFISFEQIDGPPAVIDATPKQGGTPCTSPRCGSYVQANLGILGNGSSAAYRLIVRVKPSIEAAIIRTRATVVTTSLDLSFGDNDREVVVFAGPNADLVISASRAADTEGGQIPISIEVWNHGPDPVNTVKVSNYLQPRSGPWDFVETVRFVSATPSQGTCSPPEILSLIGSPTPPPIWTLDCTLGSLGPGVRVVITLFLERTARGGRFTHFAFVSPDQNDPTPANNESRVFVDLNAPRRRATKR
jgi:uncharacterized repeat protein (TIGR01451 family)